MIVRGLIAVLRALYNGLPVAEVLRVDARAELARLGLNEHCRRSDPTGCARWSSGFSGSRRRRHRAGGGSAPHDVRGFHPRTSVYLRRDISGETKSECGEGRGQIAVAGEAALEGQAEAVGAGLGLGGQGRVVGLGLIDQFFVVAEIHVAQFRMAVEAHAVCQTKASNWRTRKSVR